jgi:hypothetical protein
LEWSRERRKRGKEKINKTQGMKFSFHTSSKQQQESTVLRKTSLPFPKIPFSWPAAGPGKHWTGGSGHSCHFSSACRCAPREEGKQGDERKNCQPKLEELALTTFLGGKKQRNLGIFFVCIFFGSIGV